jgi:hypothetical protein
MNFSKSDISEDLKDLYKEAISLYSNDDDWKINVLIFQSDYETLRIKWNKVSSAVAMCYQADINDENEFEKWNLYIIYVCTDKVNKELKAKIENDKFSSRKIVVTNPTEKLTSELVNNLIIEHITSTDLIDIVNKTEESVGKEYEPKNKSIWSLISKGQSIMGSKKLQTDIIEQLKKVNYED